jgi:adenine-specific DNA-methyltransferase
LLRVVKTNTEILGRCEFGKDDYSLNIVNLPESENETPLEEEYIHEKIEIKIPKSKKKKTDSDNQPTLFQ